MGEGEEKGEEEEEEEYVAILLVSAPRETKEKRPHQRCASSTSLLRFHSIFSQGTASVIQSQFVQIQFHLCGRREEGGGRREEGGSI